MSKQYNAVVPPNVKNPRIVEFLISSTQRFLILTSGLLFVEKCRCDSVCLCLDTCSLFCVGLADIADRLISYRSHSKNSRCSKMDTEEKKKYAPMENVLNKINQKYICLPDDEKKINTKILEQHVYIVLMTIPNFKQF
ncbi:hypothetical protein JTB14_006123 [Gonioctena quinquepunctata]|nr:hypothetical protein JTB14_006123 [Gonioctena quinquepunctata]